MKRKIHMCQSVRGALINWNKKNYKGFLEKDGRPLSFEEAREVLMDELAQGHEVIPMTRLCEGFDYKKGCPGHLIND